MFTKWYKLALRARFCYTNIAGMKDCIGTTFTIYGKNASQRYPSEFGMFGLALERCYLTDAPTTTMVSIGKGATPATENDYKLETPYTDADGLAVTSGKVNIVNGENEDVLSNTYMITNNGTENAVISEIGLFLDAPVASGSTATGKRILAERTVLDDPVTVAPGDSATIKYEIVVKYPTA